MPNRQEPATFEMILHMCKMAKKEHEDSCMAAFRDWLIVGINTGMRKSNWAQEHHIEFSDKFAIWGVKLGSDGSSKASTQKDLVLLGKN
eukprot:4258407-Ditylum_brightwellii.AAC.1